MYTIPSPYVPNKVDQTPFQILAVSSFVFISGSLLELTDGAIRQRYPSLRSQLGIPD
jgi:hypothetical protein